MIRRPGNILLFLIFATAIFAAPNFVSAQLFGGLGGALETIVGWAGKLLLGLTSLITILGGVTLNAAVFYTVVDMAKNFGQIATPINESWTIIRDVANMGFIFVLLFASIKLIIGTDKGETNRLIVNMVIAAILINFSMFFTKVIIDVANLLAITFYNVIAPGASAGASQFYNFGISNSMMAALKVTTIMKIDGAINGMNVLYVSILSSVVLLISAFVFFATAIMFVIRYVVLIFVIILSPIAFVSKVLPGLDDPAKKWWDALIHQAFFAPIYFLLMIVTIKIANGMSNTMFGGASGFGNAFSGTDTSAVGTPINFGVITAFIITSLVVAKDFASKAPGGVGKVIKWGAGLAGGATFGLAGFAGRRTLGAAGMALADSERLKKAEEKGGMSGAMARLALVAGRKTSKQSFDMRATALTSELDAGKPQKGGYEQFVKDEAKRIKEEGEARQPSAIVMDEAQQAADKANLELLEAKRSGNAERIKKAEEEARKAKARLEELKGVDKKEIEKRRDNDIKNDPATRAVEKLNDDIAKKQKELETALTTGEEEIKQKELDELQKNLETAKSEAEKAKERITDDYAYREAKGEFKSTGQKRKEAYAAQAVNPNLRDFGFVKNSALNQVFFVSKPNKQAAADLRKGKKPVKDQLEALLKEEGELKGKDDGGDEKTEEKKDDKDKPKE